MPVLSGTFGRLERAYKNFMEAFCFFLGTVLFLTLSETGTMALSAAI
jgi:uncharacterized MAPEG superfamily protein